MSTLKLFPLLLFIASIIQLSYCKIPKKFAGSKDDKSLYCNICENILIDVETKVMEVAAELSGSVTTRVNKQGKRKKKTFSYEFDEDDINGAIDNVCSDWGQNLGTSKQNDGRVVMLKSTNLQGSFSGSLNFGGEASAKVQKMCKSNIKKQRKNIIEVVSENDYDALTSFCINFVSKKSCTKIKFPDKLAKQIKDLGARGISDDEEEDEDEQVELMEDDEKEEL